MFPLHNFLSESRLKFRVIISVLEKLSPFPPNLKHPQIVAEVYPSFRISLRISHVEDYRRVGWKQKSATCQKSQIQKYKKSLDESFEKWGLSRGH